MFTYDFKKITTVNKHLSEKKMDSVRQVVASKTNESEDYATKSHFLKALHVFPRHDEIQRIPEMYSYL